MKRFLLCTALLFCSCASPTERMQKELDQVNGALATQKKNDAAVAGKEADLNRAAMYAYKLDPSLGMKILDAQLTLTGPQVTAEAVLEQQVKDLQQQKTELLDNIQELKKAKQTSDTKVDGLVKQVETLALKDAAAATEEQKDQSWGGLYGLVKYGKKSLWTMLWIGLGLVVLILLLRFSSIWLPEVGILLTCIEHGVAFVFHLFVRVVGPGAIAAAGWVKSEVTSTPTPVISSSVNTTTPPQGTMPPNPTAAATPSVAIVTPTNTLHVLFGKALTVVKEDAEYVYAELKDGVHWIEARFERSEVTTPAVEVPPAPANAPEAPTPAPVVEAPAPVTPVAPTPAY